MSTSSRFETRAQTAHRRMTQGMTAEERMEVFRRAGVKSSDAMADAMRRTGMTLQQAFMVKETKK